MTAEMIPDGERVVGVRFHPVGKIYHFDPGLTICRWAIG